MIISLIAAMDRNRIIGRDNALPWSMPADLKHFRDLTAGKPVIMGRRTYESIGKPLPDRLNIILTRNPDYHPAGCAIAHTPQQALASAGEAPEVMVIGGERVFGEFLASASKMHLTFIDAEFAGDTVFPEWDPGQWRQTAREAHPANRSNPHSYVFVTLERKTNG